MYGPAIVTPLHLIESISRIQEGGGPVTILIANADKATMQQGGLVIILYCLLFFSYVLWLFSLTI